MGEKYPLEQIFYTNISCWNLLSGRFMPRKESEKNMALSERYKI